MTMPVGLLAEMSAVLKDEERAQRRQLAKQRASRATRGRH